MDRAFLEERITATKAAITAYEEAILAIATGGAQVSYKLDTGQTAQWVTKNDLRDLEKALEGLYNRLTILQKRLNQNGLITRPSF